MPNTTQQDTYADLKDRLREQLGEFEVCVEWSNGDTETWDDPEEATSLIIEAWSSGNGTVEQVWAQPKGQGDDPEKTVDLGCVWSVRLDILNQGGIVNDIDHAQHQQIL
jgi:hypothetical protein